MDDFPEGTGFPRLQIKVRPVKRWIVTKFEATANSSQSTEIGEYDNEDTADAVALAVCKAEHEKLGLPAYDDRVQYPRDKFSRAEAEAAA